MNCNNPLIFVGRSGSECYPSKPIAALMTRQRQSYTEAQLSDLATQMRTIIAGKTAGIKGDILVMNAIEKTTDDLTITTTNLNYKVVEGKPVPSMIAYLRETFCDYMAQNGYDGQTVDVLVYMEGKKWGVTKNSDGTYSGMRFVVNKRNDLPSDPLSNSYPFYFFARDLDQWDNMEIIPVDYTLTELTNLAPVGLKLSVVTPYNVSTGILQVKITTRDRVGFAPTPVLADADFETLISSVNTPAISIDDFDGVSIYDLLIQKSVIPENLEVGDKLMIRVTDEAAVATFYGYVSNTLSFTVKT